MMNSWVLSVCVCVCVRERARSRKPWVKSRKRNYFVYGCGCWWWFASISLMRFFVEYFLVYIFAVVVDASSIFSFILGISYILILFFAAINSLVWNAILSTTTTTGEQEKNNNNVKCPLIPNPYANKHQSRRTAKKKKKKWNIKWFAVSLPIRRFSPSLNGKRRWNRSFFSIYHFSSVLMTQTRTWRSIFKVKRDKHLIATRCEINIQLYCHRSLAALYILIFIVLPCLDVTCTCFQTFHSILIYTDNFFFFFVCSLFLSGLRSHK